MVPALWCFVAVAAGIIIPELEQQSPGWAPLLFGGGVDGSRSLLSTIAGAMISVTGLVFSITIVVLQLASSQFSPRVLSTFLDDRVPQHTLGVFAASFLYSLTVLRSVGVAQEGNSSVPQLAVTVAFLLVLASVAMFLWFIHHITRSISVTYVIHQIADEARALLARDEVRRPATGAVAVAASTAARQRVAVARRPGVLTRVDRATLVRRAAHHDVRIELLHRLGTFLPESAPLALVHGGSHEKDWSSIVGAGVELADARSMQQDLPFGLRQLVDIAERALSPGVNDPTTAVEAIDQLHDLLCRLATAPAPVCVVEDADGAARLVTREWAFGELLDLAVDEVAHWGADSLQVSTRLRKMLRDLTASTDEHHRARIRHKAEQVTATFNERR